jgi:nicotinamidase-related amidase
MLRTYITLRKTHYSFLWKQINKIYTSRGSEHKLSECILIAGQSTHTTPISYLILYALAARFQVCIWPEHCLIGTTGHAVTPSINAAAQAWCGETHRSVDYVWKGQNLNTEMYSAMAAEVPVEKDKETQFNVSLMKKLNSCDKLIVCGQALSHCVNFTTRDIVSRWTGSKSNIIVLSDCTSAINFT